MQHTAIRRQRYGQHPRRIEAPSIVWLPAPTGVEGRLIEHHHRMAVLNKTVHHPGGKLRQLGIVPVEFGGHALVYPSTNVHSWSSTFVCSSTICRPSTIPPLIKRCQCTARLRGQTPGLTPPRHSGTTHQLFVLWPSGRGLWRMARSFRTVCTCRGRGGDREGDICCLCG